MGLFEKKKKTPIQNLKKEITKTPAELASEARLKLEQSRKTNLNIIDREIRNIRYDRKHGVNKNEEKKRVLKIKNAYYALHIIDKFKDRLIDIQTTADLSKAMNDITDAAKIINRVNNKGAKPKTGKFVKQYNKMEDKENKEMEKLEEISDNYSQTGIGSLVNDSLIEALIEGKTTESCLQNEIGIEIDADELHNTDFIGEDGVEINMNEINDSNEDIDDFNFDDFGSL